MTTVLLRTVALLWLLLCVTSYHYYNQGYYAEKIGVFFAFIGRLF